MSEVQIAVLVQKIEDHDLSYFLDLLEDAQLWRALKADCDAEPCLYPCLRDDLHDWIMARAAHNTQAK